MASPMVRFFMVCVLVMASLLVYVWYHSKVIDLGYQVQKLKMEEEKLRKEHRQLFIKAASLASLDRIERVASEKLGMIYPSEKEVVLVQRISILNSKNSLTAMKIPEKLYAKGMIKNKAGMFW